MKVRAFLVAIAAIAATAVGASVPATLPGPPTSRVVAIGDIHGDLDALLGILQRTGLVDAPGTWSGGTSTLVQVGDMIDRGPKSRGVMDLLMALQEAAPRTGGRVIVLLGNHEAMNLYGDLRYNTAADAASFADDKSEDRRRTAYAAYASLAGNAAMSAGVWMAAHPPGFIERRAALGPSGTYGKWLRTLPAVARVDDSLFVHAGISPAVGALTLEKINAVIASEIDAFDAAMEVAVDKKIAQPFDTLDELRHAFPEPLARYDGWLSVHEDGPLWFRGYETWSDADGGPVIDRLVKSFAVSRIVIGHDTQAGEVRTRFGAKAFLIDTGMLAGYVPRGRASALTIQDRQIGIVYATAVATSALR